MPITAYNAWRKCIASAFRTALACTIVGITSLYGPTSINRFITFPAFSYVTVILIIVTDATLGDTLHGCWLALYASCQTIGPAILSLWLIGPGRMNNLITALAVGIAGLVVVVPKSTHLKTKRIALGQIVITYVIAFINGSKTEPVMHPLHVAASTGLGVVACVLALLLPFPRLACKEVKQNCKMLAANTSERLKIYIKAFCEEDDTTANGSISRAKLLSAGGTSLHDNIKRYQPSMKWETIPFKFLKPQYYKNSEVKLQEVEMALRGMEMALTNKASLLTTNLGGEIKEGLLKLEDHIGLIIRQSKNNYFSCDSLSVNPESNSDNDILVFLQTLTEIPKTLKDLPSFFFLFCTQLLEVKSTSDSSCQKSKEGLSNHSKGDSVKSSAKWDMKSNFKKVVPGIKFGISLGLSVYLGLKYSKENGYWSGLPVAISFAAAREATFKIANVKAQGTVLGTVYGVFGCFLFQRFLPVRFLSLLPWFIFTSFLSRSKMYGQAGGISAVIGAVLILGRKNFGKPSDFAIARIIETFIGLSCSILVEIAFRPTRASTLAKKQLSKSLKTLHDCVSLFGIQENKASLIENQKKLKTRISELKKFIEEADLEPNFWFWPFHSSCYGKLLGSLSRSADLLFFAANGAGLLAGQAIKHEEEYWKLVASELDGDVKSIKDLICSVTKCLEEITSVKSLEKAIQRNISSDVEMGRYPNLNFFRVSGSDETDEKMVSSFLQHSKEVIDMGNNSSESESGKEWRSQMVLNLSAIGYCLRSLIKETREIEEGVKEIIQWENPSSNINLHDISSKVHAFLLK